MSTNELKAADLIIDGSTHEDRRTSIFAGDGQWPPFVVFDADAQCNVSPYFETRAEAERFRDEILQGLRG